MKDDAMGFFNLPLEKKTKYPVDRVARQGYVSLVGDDQKLNLSDTMLFRLGPAPFPKLELWLTSPPELKYMFYNFSRVL